MSDAPKYYFCLFTLEGHKTWRMVVGKTMDEIQNSLKLTKDKVTAKKFFEIDRLTGTMEEF